MGAFDVVGAEVTGAAVVLSKQYHSYKRSGKHLLQIFRFRALSLPGCSTC